MIDEETRRLFESMRLKRPPMTDNLTISVERLQQDVRERFIQGMQWINSFDGFNPVLTGPHARAYYANQPVDLPERAEYRMNRFDDFLRYVKTGRIAQGIPDITYEGAEDVIFAINIPTYACRIVKDDEARSQANDVNSCGSRHIMIHAEHYL